MVASQLRTSTRNDYEERPTWGVSRKKETRARRAKVGSQQRSYLSRQDRRSSICAGFRAVPYHLRACRIVGQAVTETNRRLAACQRRRLWSSVTAATACQTWTTTALASGAHPTANTLFGGASRSENHSREIDIS